jgi:hydrogenase maturation protease
MTTPRILIACIGNIFMGDDAFGVEVARRLASKPLQSGVAVKDFGIRGIDLTYALLDPYDLVVLVDACSRGGRPGTVYLIEPSVGEDVCGASLETHGMNPVKVLRSVKLMGGVPGRILLVGCEPADLGSHEEGKMGLSEPVLNAVGEAVSLIEDLIAAVPARESTEALAQTR